MTTPYIITKSYKSTGIAILLTLLFGPIGLFYASVFGGFIMTLIPILLLSFSYYYVYNVLLENNLGVFDWAVDYYLDLYIIGISLPFIYWLVIITWAVLGVRKYNRKLDAEALMHAKYTI